MAEPVERRILRRTSPSDEEIVINFGPQHPSTHGVIDFVTQTNGEVIRRSIPDIGYLHRGLERIGETVSYPGYMPFTDRIDYLAAMFANEGYAMAVERLLRVEVPPRAKYLRAIAGELCRISNHWVAVGTMASDIRALAASRSTLPRAGARRSCATSTTWTATSRNGTA
jgi:NADH-quinone oxidoreductase subunit D